MKRYTKEIILGVFLVAIVGLSIVQYQYANIGVYVARVEFQKHLSDAFDKIRRELSTENELTFLLYQAVTADNSYFDLPVDSLQRAASGILHDFLKDRLLGAGVQADFGYTLSIGEVDRPALSYQPREAAAQVLPHTVVVGGYFQNVLGTALSLKFYFYDINSYIFQKLNGIVIPSIVFTLLIILVTVWVFRRTYYQNRVITTTNDFINNLTHELKTPVFSIGIATKLLEDDPKYSGHPALEHIKLQNNRLKGHIEKVLSLAEMEQRGYVMKRTRTELSPLLAQLAEEYRLKGELEGFTFSASFPPDLLMEVDAPNLVNALVNLIENAIKYGDQGPVSLTVTERNGSCHFRVEDEGPGIPKSQQEAIFKKYYRIPEGNQHNQKGFGLGLHYVRQVVRFHKGRIVVDSAPGEGTAITLILPKA
ncbi:MAG: HAMP domain-containing histidine kinase [Lewinella sp.]|nr:HAMP domain-containing histidine kinase [Lewinella sp.]